MSEEQKPQPQSDFFSDLMFGRPPMPPEQNQSPTENEPTDSGAEQPQPDNNASEQNKQPDQLESIFALVDSLGPVIAKLGPLATAISSYFNQDKKSEKNEKNANE
ncbi:hypothetical protein [Halalkalibacter akibai]|uniref:Uncharacterized protein n=1 Tax=Halalkalibacter akibai (strain ATCC 43226 / DSM 21942 / CIP 109018 / JCM 9157 / 1139) TaxID=1236973 RepID=W4QTP3_HALA3|nr:hypothetical protein [Halalkalibacter akibai]GAE35431.1 hypothetical protein JCM9157_2535 [Halalkalibacter akibai JCM 9157]